LRNDVVDVGDFVMRVKARYPEAELTYNQDNLLPFPYDLDDGGLRGILGQVPHTSLDAAIDETVAMFKGLLAEQRIDLKQLEG
jgi:isocitrate lyase